MTTYGRIDGKNVLVSGTVVLTGDEVFEFDYQNAIYAVQFIVNDSSTENKAAGRVEPPNRIKFTFENVMTSLGVAATFGAGSTPEGKLIVRFVVHTIGPGDAANRALSYTLMLEPKAS